MSYHLLQIDLLKVIGIGNIGKVLYWGWRNSSLSTSSSSARMTTGVKSMEPT